MSYNRLQKQLWEKHAFGKQKTLKMPEKLAGCPSSPRNIGYSYWNFVYTKTYSAVIPTLVSPTKEKQPMSKTQLEHQTHASTAQLAPLLDTAEATTKHQSAALTEETPLRLRSIQSQNRNPKPKQRLSFCPMCQTLLRAVANSPALLKCKKCGYKVKLDHAPLLEARFRQHPNEIAVIDKEKANLNTHPIVKATCEKCGRTESEAWTIAVGSEGAVSAWVFLKCTNCGFIRRELG